MSTRSSSTSDCAHGQALRLEERVGHGPADEERIDAVEQVLDHLEFVRDLRAAEDGDERPLGRSQRLAEVFDFVGHQESGSRLGHVVHDALGRGVRAVRRPERIVDVHVGQARERLGERRIVLLFLRVEAQVLEQDDAAAVGRDHVGRRGPDAVRRERDRPVEQRGQMIGDGLQRELRIGLALGASEVRREDDRGALIERVGDGRQRRPDPRVVA